MKRIEYDIAEKLGLTEQEFAKRKQFILLTEEDEALLRDVSERLGEIPDAIFEDFYEHPRAFRETRPLVEDDVVVAKLIGKQKVYFKQLISGTYDMEYMLDRLRVGYRHVEFGIVPMWYIGSFTRYMTAIQALIKERCAYSLEEYGQVSAALQKVALLDIVMTLESYHYAKYRLQETLEQQVRVDALTGTFNRRKFDEVVHEEFKRFHRYGQPLTTLVLDVDHFKKVNDTWGHGLGDTVLQELCSVASTCLREVDFLFRYGGEEFIILLPSQGMKTGEIVAERIRGAMEEHEFPHGERVTVSIGVAELRENDTVLNFVKRADAAMYRAKNGGRNRVCVA